MNTKTKRRMVVVTGVIIMVLVVVLAVVGGSGSAKPVAISDLTTGNYADQKIQVSGNVVENSYKTEDNTLTFDIYDANGDAAQHLQVRYEGGVSATFGNDVTAICTGKLGRDGVLNCTELVTKCPSKYENATSALTDRSAAGVRRRHRQHNREGGGRREGRHADGGRRRRPVRACRCRESR